MRAVRARIADALRDEVADDTLGSITLQMHQRVGVGRVRSRLAAHGGCLLADEVGRGKTYVALAVARQWRRPLLVVPASLRPMWSDACSRADAAYPVVTHEALSRGRLPRFEPDGIVVDESHRFRSPDTRRHAEIAELAAGAELLLLSATPIHNRSRDLAAQLSLFLGSSAFDLDEAQLARHVVRVQALAEWTCNQPRLATPRWLHSACDDSDVLRAILALETPPRAMDAGDAAALRVIGLVRAWASSRAALAAMLRRRRRHATAIEQCAMDGRQPTTSELRAWQGADDGDVQLGFPSLLADATVEGAMLSQLLAVLAAERAGLTRLEYAVRSTPHADEARVAALRAVVRDHPGEPVLAFTEFAATARWYHAELSGTAGVGLLTGREGRIASGRIGRHALLARFAPRAQGAPPPPARERVTLLIATDLLSEGVNLQDASVVVHLDLPWNPARLAQRVGRLRRPGGAPIVSSYLFAPPAGSEMLLHVERRLRRKLQLAARTMGRSLPVVPTLTLTGTRTLASPESVGMGSADAWSSCYAAVSAWRSGPRTVRGHAGARARVLIGAAAANCAGWIAVLGDGRLVASVDGAPPDDSPSVLLQVTRCGGSGIPAPSVKLATARTELATWLGAERVADLCGVVRTTSLLRRLERRMAQALSRAPRHHLAHLYPLAAGIRAALGPPLSLGQERLVLRLLLEPADPMRAMDWMERVGATIARRQTAGKRPGGDAPVALLVLVPASPRG